MPPTANRGVCSFSRPGKKGFFYGIPGSPKGTNPKAQRYKPWESGWQLRTPRPNGPLLLVTARWALETGHRYFRSQGLHRWAFESRPFRPMGCGSPGTPRRAKETGDAVRRAAPDHTRAGIRWMDIQAAGAAVLRPMIRPTSCRDAPNTRSDRTNRSNDTVASAASIFATRD